MALLLAGCSSVPLPWNRQPSGEEVNLAFQLDRNVVRLQTVEINGRRGNFIFGSATRTSVIDTQLASSLGAPRGGYMVQVSEKRSLRVNPVIADLGGAADAIVGADVIGKRAVTVDYRLGMVTYQLYGIEPALMTLYRFSAAPEITVTVDGRTIPAIVDTTNPDTLVIPGDGPRVNAAVTVGGIDFGTIDIGRGAVERARIGNRLLSHFLVTIDYGKGVVGLFRDPREPKIPVTTVSQPPVAR
jgi:hypothetical protein